MSKPTLEVKQDIILVHTINQEDIHPIKLDNGEWKVPVQLVKNKQTNLIWVQCHNKDTTPRILHLVGQEVLGYLYNLPMGTILCPEISFKNLGKSA